VPWLARKWDTTLAAVTDYRYRWQHHSHRRVAGAHPILGPEPPAGTGQQAHWVQVRSVLERNAITIALRHLQAAGHEEAAVGIDGDEVEGRELGGLGQFAAPRLQARAPWLNTYLHHHAAACRLGSDIDYTALASWIYEVEAYRHHHGMTETATPLGPPPTGDEAHRVWTALVAAAPLDIPPVALLPTLT
jgi:hypothetical protein